jgi:hypothetical protein
MGTTVKPRFMVPPVAIVAAGAETFMLKSETCSVMGNWPFTEPSLAVTTTG